MAFSIEANAKGYTVRVGQRITLPGIYLTELDAQRAGLRHEGMIAQGTPGRIPKSKKEKPNGE
jgi:hypothetical protein